MSHPAASLGCRDEASQPSLTKPGKAGRRLLAGAVRIGPATHPDQIARFRAMFGRDGSVFLMRLDGYGALACAGRMPTRR